MDNRQFIGRAEANLLKDEKPVTQMGLYAENEEDVLRFTKRVSAFNLRNLGTPVALNILNYEKGDEICSRPHVKFTLQFKNKAVMARFWRGE